MNVMKPVHSRHNKVISPKVTMYPSAISIGARVISMSEETKVFYLNS